MSAGAYEVQPGYAGMGDELRPLSLRIKQMCRDVPGAGA